MIEDVEKKNLSAAFLRVETCVEGRPGGYEGQNLLAIGLTLGEQYRNQGHVSEFMIPVLKERAQFAEFQNATFCFTTSVKNKAVNKIAKKLDSKEVSHYSKDRDFAHGKQKVELKTFVIPQAVYKN